MSNNELAMVIRNGNVLLPNGQTEQADVQVLDGLISKIGQNLHDDKVIDADSSYVLPGIIDLHTHGIGPVSVADGSLAEMAAFEASRGCTTFYPTFFAPPEELIEQLKRHRRETDELRLTPNVAGFRLESPYLATSGGGASNDLAEISESLTDQLLEAGGGHIKIWDISPELTGAQALISRLSHLGIICSIAHTRASIEQAHAAANSGAKLVTHLFDTFAVPEMQEPGAYPAGLVDYLLIEDRLTCEIIADGLHVHPILIEKALRCKTPDRLAFVTDSNRGAGLAPGRYSLGEWGDVLVRGPNDGLRLTERGVLAGSALTPIDIMHNVVQLFGQNLNIATRLCAGTPARVMGLNKGEIAPGREADIIVVSQKLELQHVLSRGRVVWTRG